MISPPTVPDRPLSLAVLGAAALTRGAEPVQPVLAQPKRFGLLVYITLRHPDAYVSRDELLGVFWPDSTEQRARASLRQGLRFLRGHLGAGTIVNRGDADVRIAPGAMECDALAVHSALDAGEDARAVARYPGELLPGFALRGAHPFERWLHAERQALRTRVLQAALRVADAAEDRDDPETEIEWLEWAVAREPTDESVARRLIERLAEAGNRGAAVAVGEVLTARLREELGLEPSAETLQLLDAVRKQDGTDTDAAGSARVPGSVRSLSAQRVLVLPLQGPAQDSELASLGALAADVIAQGLGRVPELEVVPPMATLGASSPGVELARRAGAGTLVEGTCHRTDERLQLQVRITDVAAGRLRPGPEPVAGTMDDPFEALRELRDRVATTLASALTRRAAHLRGAATPPSLQAYQAYVDGMDRFIHGAWRDALQQFREAAEQEPTYALPRIVSAITHWNLGELPEAGTVAEEASELRNTLGQFERAVLDMVLGWLDGDWSRAHAAARIQAELAPGSIPHFQVAEEARRLNRPREARDVLARLDPCTGELRGWIYYWIELATVHHMLGDHRRELEIAHRCRRLHPDDPRAALIEIGAQAALGRVDEMLRTLDGALALPGHHAPLPGPLLHEAALELQAHGRPDDAAPLLEHALDWFETRQKDATGPDRVLARRDRARALYHAGRLEEAEAIFQELVEPDAVRVHPVGHHHGQLQAHLDEGYLAVIAARRGDHAAKEHRVEQLRTAGGPFLYGAHRFWLAAVAAVEDAPERAVGLLRQAFAEGLPHERFLHTDPHLARLRGTQRFDQLLRPRG